MMTKFFQKLSINILFTLAKFQVDWISISKVIENFCLGGGLEAPPKMDEGLMSGIVCDKTRLKLGTDLKAAGLLFCSIFANNPTILL